MLIAIGFKEPLERKAGRGWLPGGTGGVFPPEIVVRTLGEPGEYCGLVLKEPTLLSVQNDVVILRWDIDGRQICVATHVSKIDSITFRDE